MRVRTVAQVAVFAGMLLCGQAFADVTEIEFTEAVDFVWQEISAEKVTIDLNGLPRAGIVTAQLYITICPEGEEGYVECEVAAIQEGVPVMPAGKLRYYSKVAYLEQDCVEVSIDVSHLVRSIASSQTGRAEVCIGGLSDENLLPFRVESLDSGARYLLEYTTILE